MDQMPVTAAVEASTSWKLAEANAARAQGLIVSPFAALEVAEAMFLALPSLSSGAWLAALRGVIAITAANGAIDPSAAIAFTAPGLAAMGLHAEVLQTFSTPFVEGMQQPDRQRRLHDLAGETVIEGGALWSGQNVGALLLVYAGAEEVLDALIVQAEAVLQPHSVNVTRRQRLYLRYNATGPVREHFGFVDGTSQPSPCGKAIVTGTGTPFPRDPWHTIAAGDLLMGHINAHDEPAPGPIVAVNAPNSNLLPAEGAPEGYRNLGLDGTYLVVRELRQDVPAFWRSMHDAADALGDPARPAGWFAERVIGRTTEGDMLVPGGTVPRAGADPGNAFGFIGTDPDGAGCPLGSHVRRANPRDGLAANREEGPGLLTAANNHRFLRRGRKFGPKIADPMVPDTADRGLLFMALNTDITRQFEFVQQTWMLNRGFACLFHETDPLLGPKGAFTIPAEPLRCKVEVETFIQMAGGEYFFLPSLPALDYLATLTGPTA